MDNFGLLERDLKNILIGLKQFDKIEKAVIFGSRAMGNYKKASDIDIAVFGKDITFKILSKLNYKLNEELPIPYFIDTLHFETTKNENLKKHILQEGKVIFTT